MRELLKANIAAEKLVIDGGIAGVDILLPEIVDQIILSENAKELLHTQVEVINHRIPVADSWQPGHVGRAVIYTNWFAGTEAFFKNIASALKGESAWFPNIQAWWNGNLSLSQLLFGSLGSPVADRPNPVSEKRDIVDTVDEVEEELEKGRSTKSLISGLHVDVETIEANRANKIDSSEEVGLSP